MTEEQLLAIDQLSREGIDERLRVLDNVSGTINRCIEELLKLRSSLPRSSKPKTSEQQPTDSKTDSKEQEAAPQVSAPKADEQQQAADTTESEKSERQTEEKVDMGASQQVESQEEKGSGVLAEEEKGDRKSVV